MIGHVRGSRWLGWSALCAMAMAPHPAAAQTAAPAADAYAMPQTETFELKADDGYPYQIFVSAPKGEAPPEGYPVLYVLDGNAMFAGFAEARRIQEFNLSPIGRTIIVGIGYKTDQPYDTTRRLYDFTQDFSKPIPPAQQRLAALRAGGRDKFRDFIARKLRPEIAGRYTVDPRRQSLYGHSLGGLFGLYMLFNHPNEFHAIVAASPSIWWNEQAIIAEERAFAAKLAEGKLTGVPSRIRIVTGELEESAVNTTDAQAMAKRLELLSAHGLRSQFELLGGETHISVPSRSVTSTLRFVSARP